MAKEIKNKKRTDVVKDGIALNWKRIPVESKIYHYQVCVDGKVIKTLKRTLEQTNVKPSIRRGKLMVKVAQKEYCVKHLVANAFIPRYQKGDSVTHKDQDINHCAVGNLIVFKKSELGKITGGDGRRKPLFVNGEEYYSARECAKDLHCSYQTLLDYINGKVKNSVLNGLDIRYVKK